MAEKLPITVLYGATGYSNTLSPQLIKPSDLADVRNATFRYGTIRRRNGYRLLEYARQFSTKFRSILPYGLNTSGGTWTYGAMFSNGERLSKCQNLTTTLVASGLSAGTTWRDTLYAGEDMFLVNGHDIPRVFENGSTVRYMGIVPPSAALSGVSAGTGDVSAATGFRYKYKYWDQTNAVRSAASPVTNLISCISAQHIALTLASSDQSNALWKRIYRTSDGGTDYYYISAVSGTTYNDSTLDAALILNDPLELTSAENTLEGLPPVARFVTQVPGMKRIFMAGYGVTNGSYTGAAKDTLYWSEEGQPEYFVASSNEELGFEITGLAPIDDRLLAFSPTSTHTLSIAGGTTMVEVARDEYHGCAAPETIAASPYGIIFLDAERRDVCISNGARAVNIASQDIRDTLNGLSRAYLKDAVGMYYPMWQEYWLCVPNGATKNNIILVVNLTNYPNSLGWTKFTDTYFQAMAMAPGVVDATSAEFPIGGDDYGRAHQLDIGTNDGYSTVVSGADGRQGTVLSATTNTLTDESATFPTTGQGLQGAPVRILSGTGSAQSRRIASNTATTLTLEAVWTTLPDTTSGYTVGASDFYAKTRAIDLGTPTREKRVLNADVNMRSDY